MGQTRNRHGIGAGKALKRRMSVGKVFPTKQLLAFLTFSCFENLWLIGRIEKNVQLFLNCIIRLKDFLMQVFAVLDFMLTNLVSLLVLFSLEIKQPKRRESAEDQGPEVRWKGNCGKLE